MLFNNHLYFPSLFFLFSSAVVYGAEVHSSNDKVECELDLFEKKCSLMPPSIASPSRSYSQSAGSVSALTILLNSAPSTPVSHKTQAKERLEEKAEEIPESYHSEENAEEISQSYHSSPLRPRQVSADIEIEKPPEFNRPFSLAKGKSPIYQEDFPERYLGKTSPKDNISNGTATVETEEVVESESDCEAGVFDMD